MIELSQNALVFTCPEVHPEARLEIKFQRTLRIPDDDSEYPLPPGLGAFPLRHVDDFANRVSPLWLEHGGVMLPIYQSEAMWLDFGSAWVPGRGVSYPFAIKISAGKICAVTGKDWDSELHRRKQDYLVAPKQPWLDGYCVEEGLIRQFVAMPLGAGYTAEEQLTGKAEHGGLQVLVCPMKREVFEQRFPKPKRESVDVDRMSKICVANAPCAPCVEESAMGLAPGGKMRQKIYRDPYKLEDWDQEQGSRCFVHLANSMIWRSITGEAPPTVPPTAKEYNDAGLPWYDYYRDDVTAVSGAANLKPLQSVAALGKERGDVPLPENQSVDPTNVKVLRQGLQPGQVREGTF